MTSVGLPAPSIVIEWENAGLAGEARACAMLASLGEQLQGLAGSLDGAPEVVVVFNSAEIEGKHLDELIARVPALAAAGVRLVPDAEGHHYYELKNLGARHATKPALVFLDSDVVPEAGWLKGILTALAEPDRPVASGNTYVDPAGFYAKAFALFWFFPLRSEKAETSDAYWFFANNVGFSREDFAAHPFPQAKTFRGQCSLLAEELRGAGKRILLVGSARVRHPPPSGFYHFCARALCQGHDNALLPAIYGKASLGKAFQMLGGDVKRVTSRILGRRPAAKAGAGVVALAFLLGYAYSGLKFAGYCVSLRWPRLISRNFPI